jgi:hypothetical protein
MDEIRKGQIALIFLKIVLGSKEEMEWLLANKGKWISSDSGHEVMKCVIRDNLTKVVGVSDEEAKEFAEIFMREMIYDSWGPAAPFC